MSALAGVTGQPAPVPNDGPSAHDLVIADLKQRKVFGLTKYGSLLQPGNGRRSVEDAYEEVQDLAVYLRTEVEERRELRALATRVRTFLDQQCEVDANDLDRLLTLAAR